MSEGLFALLEGCLGHLGAIIIVLHSFLAQYFEPSIVYIFSFLVEIPLWLSYKHRNANNDIFSILRHQLRVLFPLLGVGSRD
jgi:low temperature requirement protein LtrA